MSSNLKNSITVLSDVATDESSTSSAPVGQVSLSKISLCETYREEWNVHMDDFYVMSKDGELLRPTLYRKGGINYPDLSKDTYFMLLKYKESFYEDRIMEMCGENAPKSNKYLDGIWCIFDRDGNELWENEGRSIHSPYLVKNAPIFSVGGNYYNLLTKKYLGSPSSVIQNEFFMIFDNKFEKDEDVKGIIKISKLDGTFVKM